MPGPLEPDEASTRARSSALKPAVKAESDDDDDDDGERRAHERGIGAQS